LLSNIRQAKRFVFHHSKNYCTSSATANLVFVQAITK
jgi:hypothetical protein